MRICVLLGLFMFGGGRVAAQHLYVFSVVETSLTKRPDRVLDAERLRSFTHELAKSGNYMHHWYDFGGGSRFTPQTVKATLATFTPQSADEDIVWLHYAGQGYSDGPKAWPTLQLNGGDVPLRELLAILRTKPVRTLLVTVDCGNRPRSAPPVLTDNGASLHDSLLPTAIPIAVKPVKSYPTQADIPDMAIVDAYRHLFRATKVQQIIVMASASHGQRAYSDSTRGSVWFTTFTDTMTTHIRENLPTLSWKLIQEKTTRSVQEKTHKRQTPAMNRQTITCCETEISY